jgi:hypothetical protein
VNNDENYWDRLTPEKVSVVGYYWYRDAIGAEPEIVRSSLRKKDFELFKDGAQEWIHLEFVLEGTEDMSVMTVDEILGRFPNAQVGIERIKPPAD